MSVPKRSAEKDFRLNENTESPFIIVMAYYNESKYLCIRKSEEEKNPQNEGI
jgi:hypothetical protein